MMRTVLLGDLEKELYIIRQYIDKEENPIRKANMLDRYRKIYRALTQNQLENKEFHAPNVSEKNQSSTSKKQARNVKN